MKKSLNERTINVKITRIELIDLMMACTQIHFSHETSSSTKWSRLHDKLEKILNEFDRDQTDIYE